MNISVIIPVYNAENYITRSVESALQFNEIKEVILVEDGSPDQSLKVCEKLSNNDNRIRLFRHPNGENRGAGASRNLGIEKASQEYIAFLDADDFYLPNRFEKDKIIFTTFSDADGVHNALGVHYYSETAKKQFQKKFNIKSNELSTYLTRVNPDVKPTPKNCFKGLLGLINGYGYFSLDTLTIKRSALKKMNKLFWNSSMHEDTEFLIRLSYYCKLYPGELDKAVALRGVHEENRITNNRDINKSRYLQYVELKKWLTESDIQDKLIDNLLLYKIIFHKLNMKRRRSVFTSFYYSMKHPSIFFSEYKFGSIINSTNTNKYLVPYIMVIKNVFVKLFFHKKSRKYKITNQNKF